MPDIRISRSRWVLVGLSAAAALLLGWAIVPALSAAAPTVTVTDTLDLSDAVPGDGACDTTPGTAGDQCSLRAAIEELNARGPNVPAYRIEFNLAGSGPFTITPATALPNITVAVVIDGVTQPGATCPSGSAPANLQIVLDGSSAGAGSDGLVMYFGSDGSTVRGLVIGNFSGSAIKLSSDNNIVRCTHLGLGADGITDMGNGSNGVQVNGDNNNIGGQNAYVQRNVIANNYVGVRVEGSSSNNIRGNFIGTTADGMSAAGNSYGIYVSGDSNQIGSAAALGRNVVSGNIGLGLRLNSATSNTVLGNYFGLARDGSSPLPNAANGVELLGAAISNTIGGPGPGELNLIAYNGNNGVAVVTNIVGVPVQNAIRGNSIHDNGALGIELGANGVDVNDAGDVDTGENEHQNYPVLAAGGTPLVTASLASQANTDYNLDIYRNDACDASGNGEGQAHVFSMLVTTDGSGHASQLIDLTGLVSSGDGLTATATDPDGNTSEFSACVVLTLPATATPTPTRTRTPTATATVNASASATATASATPSATPTCAVGPHSSCATHTPRRLYLPLLVQ